jgi:hypothetical protein
MAERTEVIWEEVKEDLQGVFAKAQFTTEEFVVIERAVNRLAEFALLAPYAGPTERSQMERRMRLDLATLQNVAAAKNVEIESHLRGSVIRAVRSLMDLGFRLIAPTVSPV